MERDLLRRGLLLLTCVLLTACGTGKQTRPYVVETYPAEGEVLAGPARELRIRYDSPVRVLNPADLRVFSPTEGLLATSVYQRDGEPDAIYVRPAVGPTFPLDQELTVFINEGLAVNDLDHYAEDLATLTFTAGAEPPLLFGRPGTVTLLDSETFVALDDVPTPGGRDPTGIASTLRPGTSQRIWVQLASGGGTGESLAWFEPGDVAMTAIALPTTGDLVADAAAITVGPDGRYVYAAYRDTGSDRVRVVRVDTATAATAGSLELTAVAAGPGTRPVDMRWSSDGERLVIAAADDTAGVLAFVKRETFTEQDREPGTPGVQGYLLPDGPGRFVSLAFEYWVTLPGTNDTTIVVEATGSATRNEGTETGVGTEVLAMPDLQVLVQGLEGYAGDAALQVRTAPTNIFQTFPAELSDDLGGVDQGASSVVAMQLLPGTARFAVLLDSPAGLLLARVEYFPNALFQEDLDPLTEGIQVADVESEVAGATLIGRTFGPFLD